MAKSAPASVHEDAVTGRIFEWRLYRRFLPFARPYLKWFAASVVLLLLLAVTTIAGPFVIKYATAVVISDEPVDYHWRVRKVMTYFLGAGRVDVAGAALTFWTAVFISIGLVTFGLRYLQLWVTAWTGQRVVFDLRNHVFRHVQRRSLRFFDTNPVGRLVTRVTSDIENLAELFSSGIDVVFYDLVMIAITLSLLFWVSPTMALIVLALVPFVAIWSFKFKREAQELFRNVRSRVTRLNSFINESVTGIRVIQIFRAEKRVNERFADWDADLRESHRKTVRNFSMFYPGVEMFSSLGTALIAVSGQALFAEGSIRAEDMVFFWLMLHKFFEPLRQISEKYNVLQSAIASAERISNVLDVDLEIPNPQQPIALDKPRGELEFDDVHFSYDGKQEVLKGISFRVAPGEKVAIVGHTGAGKSSLINVLGRFYDISGGSVRVDGQDIRNYDKYSLRRAVGIVLQEVFLFADTVRENLRLGDTAFDDERLREACRRVLADRFVEGLPGGLDHEVRERGATFSQGQKQLLAFARTIAHDPPILVLDEATANIDTATEQLIQRALDALMRDRTVLVIAHRLSTIKKADRILVMHHGELVQSGRHADLLKEDGVYRRLYEMQYRGQETESPTAKGEA